MSNPALISVTYGQFEPVRQETRHASHELIREAAKPIRRRAGVGYRLGGGPDRNRDVSSNPVGHWRLAPGVDRRVKVITTNFDRLFEEVLAAKSLSIERFQAPLLPVPKNRWDGLVYLHGLLSLAPTAGELDRLVVSSGDFGLLDLPASRVQMWIPSRSDFWKEAVAHWSN